MGYNDWWDTDVAAFFKWCDDGRTIGPWYVKIVRKTDWRYFAIPVPTPPKIPKPLQDIGPISKTGRTKRKESW